MPSLSIKRDLESLMRLYECVFIMRQDIPSQDVHKLADHFADLLKKQNGNVVKREYWGLRPLSYIVKKNKKGHYIMFGIEATPEAVKELERNFKINEDVIKYLCLAVDKIEEGPSLMMQAPAEAEK